MDWEDYFWPGTEILRNKLDIREAEQLRKAEYAFTEIRFYELESGQVQIPQTYDIQHLRALHHHLFQDVYDWAGQERDVPMAKRTAASIKPFAEPGQGPGSIQDYMDQAQQKIRFADWPALDREEFQLAAAEVFALVNQAHPFREGNGRSTRAFMNDLAAQTDYRFVYDRSHPDGWNFTSHKSRPEPGELAVHPEWLSITFQKITVHKDEATHNVTHPPVATSKALQERIATQQRISQTQQNQRRHGLS